ncbi:hypothetical protein Tco_0540521 [Tanacetum coccineum]
MLHNLDQLRLQFERENLHEINAKTCLEVFRTQFKEFFALKGVNSSDHLNQSWQQDFEYYTSWEPETYKCDLLRYLDILERLIDKTRIKRLIDQTVLKYGEFRMKDCEVKTIKETEKPLNEAIPHEHEIEKSFKLQSKDVQINLFQVGDANMVVMESSGIESKNNSSDNTLSKSVNETQMQMQEGKVDMESSGTKSDEHDTSSSEPQHTKQSEPIYDPYLLENVDSNTTPDSTNMSHGGGEIDQNAEKCQVSCPLLDPSFDNMTTEFSNQSLESENIFLKKTVAQLQKYFSRMEAPKIKKEIEVLETINIELEHSVAKLLIENEKLHKENKHLKQTYKDLYDSIKNTRVQTKDPNDSLIAKINSKTVENADLKAQIQEKVFANVALKTNLES